MNKIEVFRMQNGYNIDTLTSVDIHEIVKISGKVKEIYEEVFYFKVTPFLIYFFVFFYKFIHANNGFYTNDLFYENNDSMRSEN